jgi:hypothetical protein
MKPTDVFVNVVDLFAIIIPGAIAAFALEPFYASIDMTRAPGWIAFFIVAYTFGHIAYYISGRIDDVGFVKSKTDDAVTEMKRAPHPAGKQQSAYKHAKAYLAVNCPGPLAEVMRVEADSKFFRSLLVVLPFAVLLAAAGTSSCAASKLPLRELLIVLGCAPVLWVASLFLYRKLRVKAITTALRLEDVHREHPRKDAGGGSP